MDKKKILVAYYEMFLGGSTTSLLAFLNCIDKTKYDVDLQLYHNSGELFEDIPEGVNVLPDAAMHKGKWGFVVKNLKGIFSGKLLKAYLVNKKRKKKGFSGQILADLQAEVLARKSRVYYDYAIGFMEGWPDRYIASRVKARKKIGWLHNTFANLAAIPELELPWMEKVDKLIFVADNCTEDFKKAMPEMAHKAETVLNITDSEIIRAKAEKECGDDVDFLRFCRADCFKIITVCRLSMYHKGLDRIVWCAKEMKEAGEDFLWYIVGSGRDEEKLQKMIVENDVADRVVLIGARFNPHPFIKAADIMCMPSRYEGKPITVTESMILGTPPVVTEYLSAHEQIESGIEGIVVPNQDDTIVAPLKEMMDDPSVFRNMQQILLQREYGNSKNSVQLEKILFV